MPTKKIVKIKKSLKTAKPKVAHKELSKVKTPWVKFISYFTIFALLVTGYYYAQRQTAQVFEIIGKTESLGQNLNLEASWDWGSYVTATNSENINVNLNSGFVAEAWIKPADSVFVSSGPKIISKNSGSINSFALSLSSTYAESEQKYYQTYDFMVGSADCRTPNHALYVKTYTEADKSLMTTWHHVAGVVHVGGKMDIFVDGKKTVSDTPTLSNTCESIAIPVRIGAAVMFPTSTGFYYKGKIDEVHIAYYDKYLNDFVPPISPVRVSPVSQLAYSFENDLVDSTNYHRDGIATGIISYTSYSDALVSPTPSACGQELISSLYGRDCVTKSGVTGKQFIYYRCMGDLVDSRIDAQNSCDAAGTLLNSATLACSKKICTTPTPTPTPASTPTPTPTPKITPTPTPVATCTPRPACLDARPACMIKVVEGTVWCPKSTPTPTPRYATNYNTCVRTCMASNRFPSKFRTLQCAARCARNPNLR